MKAAYVPPHKRPGIIHKPPSNPRTSPVVRKDFDTETGQVYSEVEITFRKKQNSDWIGEYKTPSLVKKHKPSGLGARSLLDIAKTKCVEEFRNLTPQHFEIVPWDLASMLWAEVLSTHSESLHTWRTLATVYNNKDELGKPENRYHLEIRSPPLPLQAYFRGLSSMDVKWLTALRISPKQIPISDLVAISNIPNLAVLDLSDGQVLIDSTPSRFDERIMRTWTELASRNKCFGHLQVLMLGWQENVGAWIFKYLDCFPRIRCIIFTDCKNIHQKNRTEWEENAAAYGWAALHAKKSVKVLRPLLDDKGFHMAAVSNVYYYNYEQKSDTKHNMNKGEQQRLPIVECRIGTPRKWTHILDEFPGTRTVWFEKTKTDTSEQPEPILKMTSDADSSKRSREITGSSLQLPQSPPRKRSHGYGNGQWKAPSKTAAGLLDELGI